MTHTFQSFSISMFIFALVMCVTPGPNNLMLAASGANFGFRLTIPHILGVLLGMNLLFICAASGVAPLVMSFPSFTWALKIGGSCFLLRFAWKMVTQRPPMKDTEESQASRMRPLTLRGACLFQFLNPKGLIICVSTISMFTRSHEQFLPSVLAVLIVFSSVCIVTTSLWTGMGAILQRAMSKPLVFRWFNIVMALLTVATIAMMLI